MMILLKVLKASSFISVAAALALTGLALLSCSDDECGPRVDEPLRDTPANLLQSFTDALEEQQIDAYTACLDEAYRFEFMPDDWDSAGVTPDTPYWGKIQDVASTTNMFESVRVTSVSFDLGIPLTQMVCSDTLCLVLYHPDIQVVETYQHGTITYWVNNSRLYVTLARDPQDPDLWVIRNLEEEPGHLSAGMRDPRGLAGAGTESTTFGEVKAMFK
jgi:hypothetical protein